MVTRRVGRANACTGVFLRSNLGGGARAYRNCSAQHQPAAQRSARRATLDLVSFPSRSGGCTALSRAVTPNPSLQRTRQKRRAAELQYRWASLSAVTHFRLRSRVGSRSLISERSLSVQCCREHQQLLVASALVPTKRGRRQRSLSPPAAACLRCPSLSVLRHHRRASPVVVVTRITVGNQTRATLHSCGPSPRRRARSHRRSHAPA